MVWTTTLEGRIIPECNSDEHRQEMLALSPDQPSFAMSSPKTAPPAEANQRIRKFFSAAHEDAKSVPTTLDLSNCNLSELPSTLNDEIKANAQAAANLTVLNLAYNSLCDLPNFLARLPNLRILFLLGNQFTVIPEIVCELPSVTMLSFKSNRLSGVLHGSSLPVNISWLILTSNEITSLADDFPSRCRRVRKLMLSNNKLSALPASFSSVLQNLELLRLANNSFEQFPKELYALPNLAWLSLAGNPCTGGAVQSPMQLPSALAIESLEAAYDIDWEHPFGGGTSGTAFPGVCRKTGDLVAVKRFGALAGSDGRALDEVAVSLAASGVPGVVRAVGYCAEMDEKGEVTTVTLVTERVPGCAKCIAGAPSFDSCTRSVYDAGMRLDREDAERIVSVVEKAVEGLLERGISHGDVYGHNVLVGEKDEEGKRPVVLGDLGAAWWIPRPGADGARTVEMKAVDVFREEVMRRVKRA